MWWLKKKKKCKCPCHWSSLVGQLNPQDKHCDICTAQRKEARKYRLMSPSYQRSKVIKKLDEVTSLIVRIKADWTCQKCHRKYPPVMSLRTGLPAQNIMTTSHFFSKGAGGMGIRFDYDDLDALCIFCHQKIENHKHEFIEGFNYEKYMREKLGDEKYQLLEYKAHSITKYSIIELQIMLEQRQRDLQLLLKQYDH